MILMDKERWHGVWTALITPLQEKNLEIDLDSLERLVLGQKEAGVTGLVLAGSTGEGSLLPRLEYKKLLNSVRSIVGPDFPLVAGLGIGGTQHCLKVAAVAKESKMDGLLASPPAYIKSPRRSLKKHFLDLCQMDMPICLYEIPGRAVSSIEVELIDELRKESPLFCSVKDATGDLKRAESESRLFGEEIALLSGDDPSFFDFLEMGGHGIISVASHVLAEEFIEISQLCRSGKWVEAKALQQKLAIFLEALGQDNNPCAIKSLLAANGFISSKRFCDPLLPSPDDFIEKMKSELNSAKKITSAL